MKKFCIFKLISIVFVSTISLAYSHIEVVKTIEDHRVKEVFSNLSPDKSIVLFDCDDVLFHSSDAALQRTTLPQLMKLLSTELPARELGQLVPQITRSAEKEPLEQGMFSTIKYLQARNIPMFVLTQCSSDEEVREERFEKLSNLGIDFSSSLRNTRCHEFIVPESELKLKPFQTHTTKPIYDSGIIYCGSAPKGLVLSEFLKFIPIKSSFEELQVVFIDDAERNLIDVESTCSSLGIRKFTGIHYTAIGEIHKIISERALQFQLNYLLRNRLWLTDEDARYASALTSF